MVKQLLFAFMLDDQQAPGNSSTIYKGPPTDSRTITTNIPHYQGQTHITLRYSPHPVRYNSYGTSTDDLEY